MKTKLSAYINCITENNCRVLLYKDNLHIEETNYMPKAEAEAFYKGYMKGTGHNLCLDCNRVIAGDKARCLICAIKN